MIFQPGTLFFTENRQCAIVVSCVQENTRRWRETMKRMIRAMAILFLTVVLFCPVLVVAAGGEEGLETDMEDGEYSIQVDLEGGSGKASVTSPTLMIVKNGRM